MYHMTYLEMRNAINLAAANENTERLKELSEREPELFAEEKAEIEQEMGIEIKF